MDNKGQLDLSELSPMAVLLGFIGAIVATIIAGRMYAGTFMKIIIFVVGFILMTIICQFIANKE